MNQQINFLNDGKNYNIPQSQYIPSFNPTNNKQTVKTEKKYRYTYINVDSRYRKKEVEYDYSNYFILPSDPLKISKKSNEIFIKCDKLTLENIKKADLITIENIKPFHVYDYSQNLIRLTDDYKAEFINLDEKFKFNQDSNNNFICCVYFDHEIIKELNIIANKTESDNGQYKFYKNIKYYPDSLNSFYYFELSNENYSIYKYILQKNIKIHFDFYYVYNIPFYSLNAGLPLSNFNNNEYHVISKKNENGLFFKIFDESNLLSSDFYVFGGNNIRIRKIISVNEYYPLINEYNFELNEIYNNIVNIKMISSEFPCYINNITEKNNKLYFKSYLDDSVYSITLNNGNYSDLTLQETIESNIENIKSNSLYDSYFSSEILISENLNSFKMRLFKYQKMQTLKINYVFYYFESSDASDLTVYNNFVFCNSIAEIKKYSESYPNGHLIFVFDNFVEKDNNINGQHLKIKTEFNYICFDLFGESIYLNKKFIEKGFEIFNFIFDYENKTVNISQQIKNIMNNLSTQIMINADLFKNIYNIKLTSDNLNIENKINCSFNLLIPVRFSLLFNYPDTFGELLGFSSIGKNVAITNYEFIISNQTKYLNQRTTENYNHVNLKSDHYIFCVCDKFNNIKNNVLFNVSANNKEKNINSLTSTNNIKSTSKAFAKILIFKQNTYDNYVFNSFVNFQDEDYEKQDNIKNLKFYFFDSNGDPVDFNGLDHSFTIALKQLLN